VVSELESSFQLLVDQVSFLAVVLLMDQSHGHTLPLLKVNRLQCLHIIKSLCFKKYHTNSCWHWGDYWKLFPQSWKYCLTPKAEGSIPTEVSNVSNYLFCYTSNDHKIRHTGKQLHFKFTSNNDVMCIS